LNAETEKVLHQSQKLRRVVAPAIESVMRKGAIIAQRELHDSAGQIHAALGHESRNRRGENAKLNGAGSLARLAEESEPMVRELSRRYDNVLLVASAASG